MTFSSTGATSETSHRSSAPHARGVDISITWFAARQLEGQRRPDTFSGRVGVSSKADSVVYMDDYLVKPK
jgi:hypothetical protein